MLCRCKGYPGGTTRLPCGARKEPGVGAGLLCRCKG